MDYTVDIRHRLQLSVRRKTDVYSREERVFCWIFLSRFWHYRQRSVRNVIGTIDRHLYLIVRLS